jgi:HipA N-terminal domain
MTDQVEVWLDADFLERTRVGTLTHDRGTLRFVYEPEWLKNSQAFALDPDLSLGDSALRASPCGSACGRSNWLRQFVEPAFCLSGVRIGSVEPSGPGSFAISLVLSD